MKIFLSWSGEESRTLALALRQFLKRLDFEPWMSESDLGAGDEWPTRLLAELRESQAAIACVTGESLRSGWMHFEAAAAPVRIPLCWKIPKERLRGPLALSQACDFERDGVLKLVRDLNKGRAQPLAEDELERAFDDHWLDLATFHENPLEKLLTLKDAVKAPFLLAQAAAMRCSRGNDAREQQALRELVRQVDNLLPQHIYLPRAAKLIREHCVWAVCGNKTKQAWDNFLQANEYSHNVGGRQIERIFLPPEPKERRLIREVIQRHFDNALGVRLFPNMSAQMVYGQWNLPIGFGMTVIGDRLAGKDLPKIRAVLVHWGGFGKGPRSARYGVILEQYAWKEHFWRLYEDIALSTELVTKEQLYGPDRSDEFRQYW